MMLGVRTDCWKRMVVAQRGCPKKKNRAHIANCGCRIMGNIQQIFGSTDVNFAINEDTQQLKPKCCRVYDSP